MVGNYRVLQIKVKRDCVVGLVSDLAQIRLDPDASNVANLWMGITKVGTDNISSKCQHWFHVKPTLKVYEEEKLFTIKDRYKSFLSPDGYKILEKSINQIDYYCLDQNIYAFVLLSFLTGNQDETKNLNQTLNKMLLKKLHVKYPYQGD